MADECIFCKIVKGDLPSHKIYEDEKFITFLDIRPLNPGNSLVIPKEHHRWVYDVPEFGQYFEVVKKVGLATVKVLNAISFSIITLGFEVPHAHVRILPRFENDGHGGFVNWTNFKQISDEEMKSVAEKIRNEIGVN